VIPSSVEIFGSSCFHECESLSSTLRSPDCPPTENRWLREGSNGMLSKWRLAEVDSQSCGRIHLSSEEKHTVFHFSPAFAVRLLSHEPLLMLIHFATCEAHEMGDPHHLTHVRRHPAIANVVTMRYYIDRSRLTHSISHRMCGASARASLPCVALRFISRYRNLGPRSAAGRAAPSENPPDGAAGAIAVAYPLIGAPCPGTPWRTVARHSDSATRLARLSRPACDSF
jgi:hypothetical protein